MTYSFEIKDDIVGIGTYFFPSVLAQARKQRFKE
jgi:hypothetical protein